MIPVIIIGAYDYCEYTDSEKVKNLIRNETPSEYPNISKIPQLCDKVLELLHKEVADCFIYNINRAVPPGSPLIQQYRFQIYLKDVIQKAKGEKK